jgi:hypothetical protein
MVEIVEGELTGGPVWEAAANVKAVGAGTFWLSPVVSALLGSAAPSRDDPFAVTNVTQVATHAP